MSEHKILAELIENASDRGVEFGTPESAPSDEWIRKAEQRLGCSLPPSYIWFLRSFGGGEILGEEINSIYEIEFSEAIGGDVVYQYAAHQAAGTLTSTEVPLCRSDFGELFVLETSEANDAGEYPVYLRRGENREVYGRTFAEFLERRIRELVESS